MNEKKAPDLRKKISVVTGTRADYGLLSPLLAKLAVDDDFSLKIAVTGMHLSPEFGMTYREIEKDGFEIAVKIENLLSSDTPVGISKSISLAVMGFAEYYAQNKPDLIIVLGDRYEILAACIAAMVERIPIAHLHGGETTEGAIDEAIRHSITKMSFLHFTSAEVYRNRVIQLGEDPARVFNVGAIGLENIKQLRLMTKSELENSIGFKLDEPYLLVTYHPVTLEDDTSSFQLGELLKALDNFKGLKIILSRANSDTHGRVINQMIDDFVAKDPLKSVAFHSLGQVRYLSAMKYASAVVGNSSSGIIEAPAFKVPTINIGDRQKGRIQAKSVVNCSPLSSEIILAIEKSMSQDFRLGLKELENPYGDGNVSEKVINQLKRFLAGKINIKKPFYEGRPITQTQAGVMDHNE